MIAYRITRHDEVASTNECVKELMAAGAPEGAVVIARRQSGGYGRRGHVWTSPEGGLYLSMLLRPSVHLEAASEADLAAKAPTLSLMAGLAVRRAVCCALAPETAALVKVKWPNDVMVARGSGFAKLCGISLEGTPKGLCLGIGVNVVVPASGAEEALAYVQQLPGGAQMTVARIADSILDALAEDYEAWLAQPFAAFAEECSRENALGGRMVSVREGVQVTEGAFAGIDEQGRLLLRQADGVVRAIVSGEAHIEGF